MYKKGDKRDLYSTSVIKQRKNVEEWHFESLKKSQLKFGIRRHFD